MLRSPRPSPDTRITCGSAHLGALLALLATGADALTGVVLAVYVLLSTLAARVAEDALGPPRVVDPPNRRPGVAVDGFVDFGAELTSVR